MVPDTETNELHGCSATATALYDHGFSHLMWILAEFPLYLTWMNLHWSMEDFVYEYYVQCECASVR